MSARKRVGVLISGRGSNLQSLIRAAAAGDYPAEIVVVVSNVAGAPGLEHARRAGIAAETVPHKDYASREAFDAALDAALRRAGVEIVCLAGFMRLLTPGFVENWRDRMLNIHPSLLPAFPGLDTHARALQAGVRFAGCTVHFVRAAVDSGPIIAQAVVPVLPGDTPEALAARVLEAEHRLYPLALKLAASGRLMVADERVEIAGHRGPDGALLNPGDET
jgi:phosphoribosylglycinamide formyltransferase-1